MKTVYIPKGETVHYESLATEHLVVHGRLRVTYGVKAQSITGSGVIDASSINADTVCIDDVESGTVIFPSDAIGSQLNYDGKLPGIIYDSLGFKSAVRKVRKIQQATNGRIVFPHDAQQFSELRPAPYFYE